MRRALTDTPARRYSMLTRGQPANALSAARRFTQLCGRAFLATARPDELVEAASALSPDQWHEVFADATAQGIVLGAFTNSGQMCIHLERVYVHTSVYDALMPPAR